MKAPIKVLLLDLGGVVLKIDWMETIQSLDLHHHDAFLGLMKNIGQWEAYDMYEKGRISTSDFCGHVRRYLNLPLVEQKIVDAFNSIIVGELDSIDEILAQAKNQVGLFALSNTNEAHMAHVRVKYPSLERFEKIFTSWEMGRRKPDPEIYLEVARDIDVPPSSILFIDDSAANVGGAREAGMHAEICADSSERLCEILSSYGIDVTLPRRESPRVVSPTESRLAREDRAPGRA